MEENKMLDGSLRVSKDEAKFLLKEYNNKVGNGNVSSFVSLKGINKIYPNGVQAVYDFNMDIDEHDFIVLVGPSGCGKSTTLRMVAGLEPITSGYLYINKVLSNYLSSKDRDISMVFQSYALYPQMTVYDNIAFPLKVRKYRKVLKAYQAEACDQAIALLANKEELTLAINEADDKNLRFATKVEYVATKLNVTDLAAKLILSYKDETNNDKIINDLKALKEKELADIKAKNQTVDDEYQVSSNGELVYYNAKLTKAEIREKVFAAAKILDLGPYLDRKPNELSGGQMQRVALGRAIVRNAKLFLMDEPLSNLDAKLRVQMRSEIVRLHEQIGATTIYVTHDQTEAMTMATKIAVMSKGWVQQIGTPQEIYSHPKNIFVATFIGAPAMNILKGTYDQGVVTFADGYKMDMGEEFAKKHDSFYQAKIEDCKRMLNEDDFKKMHGIKVLEAMHLNLGNDERAFNDNVNELLEIAKSISDEEGQCICNLLANYHGNSKDLANSLGAIKEALLTIRNISSADLSALHNAQAFNSNEKKANNETMFYQKPHHNTKKQKGKVSFKVNNLTFSNNLYDVALNLLKKYELALQGSHEVNVGIRPENIHLANEFTGTLKSESFVITSNVVELMGSELLIHSDFNGVDLISKISTGTLVKPHTEVELVVDLNKVLLFDPSCGNTIE